MHVTWLVLLAASLVGATPQPPSLRQQEPLTPIPATAALDPARVAIGKRLFHDVRVSRAATYSCATCHPLAKGAMDGRVVAEHPVSGAQLRNTPTIFNVSLNASYNWDGAATTLQEHTDRILSSLMGMTWPDLLSRLREDRGYASAFAATYANDGGLSRDTVLDAMAAFEQSLLTPRSRFDRYLTGDREALTARERDGYRLFTSYGCASCHQGANVGGNMYQRFGVFENVPPGPSGAVDLGRMLVTRVARDAKVFRVPGLRNVAVTAPYFHDGRARTLEEAVETMARAQLGRRLRPDEIAAIVAFLRTLTGEYQGRPLTALRTEAP